MFKEYFEKTKPLKSANKKEIFNELLNFTKEKLEQKGDIDARKKLYYISSEFLIGKLLSNNLINLGIYDEVDTELKEVGLSLSEFEDMENEPSLGNGGLGRLAACFLDSAATLGIPGDGIGLNYHFGLFKQVFKNEKQLEEINPWIENNSWLIKTDTSYDVKFANFCVTGKMYDIKVSGYRNNCNTLHLFDLEGVDEGIVKNGIEFDKKAVKKNLTLFLYPDDSDDDGKKLRLYQQYFMVSCGAQYILDEAVKRGSNLHDLKHYVVIQINDTHPTMIIPELIYQLKKRGIDAMEAVDIVSSICAYTNHTILAEALEKWPLSYFEEIIPHILDEIKFLDKLVKEKYSDSSVWIIDKKNMVQMAAIDIHFCFSVNGVAKLHTEILKNSELANFNAIYPNKFNNKTNGITFRRWLQQANPKLTEFICELIGDGFLKDSEKLADLEKFYDDKDVLDNLLKIKLQNKTSLCDYLYENENAEIHPEGIYDIQVKRMHEYKRQQLNLMYIINKYLEIKDGKIPTRPISFIFGAKAAPAYVMAKEIIHAVLCMQKIIRSDESVNKYINLVMVENYNVSYAEKIIPACDISEQISLASKEASGTGNMKFMLNGALTLGTLDGANVEIAQYVGANNIYIFGKKSEEVIELYKKNRYYPSTYYNNNEEIRKTLDFITGKEMMSTGDKNCLKNVYENLKSKDYFMTLLDFDDYVLVKDKMISDFEDRTSWARKTLVNISNARHFSSDRTVAHYNREIWKLK